MRDDNGNNPLATDAGRYACVCCFTPVRFAVMTDDVRPRIEFAQLDMVAPGVGVCQWCRLAE